MNLREKVKSLPALPGVYLMKDSLNNIIYVGKSKCLKKRVSSYLQNSKFHSPKVIKLVKNLRDIEYILTDTEFEAFMLECKLIREIKPLYNKKMKTPLSYVYVRLSIDEKCPSIEISDDEDRDDKSLYYGPYTNRNTVQTGINGIKESCKILYSSNCKKHSPCLNYSLGLCIGPCMDQKSNEKYIQTLIKIAGMLDSSDKTILGQMENMMNSAVDKLDFESAAKYREYINAANYLLSNAKVIKFTSANQNIALLEYLKDGMFKLFLVKGNNILFSDKYKTNSLCHDSLLSIMERNILYCFRSGAYEVPLKIGKNEIDESGIIYSYLKNSKNNCRYVIIPQQWVDFQNRTEIDEVLNKLLDV